MRSNDNDELNLTYLQSQGVKRIEYGTSDEITRTLKAERIQIRRQSRKGTRRNKILLHSPR